MTRHKPSTPTQTLTHPEHPPKNTHSWMLKGLKEVDAALQAKHIPFFLLQGQAGTTVPALAKELDACAVVTDFSPLREPRAAAEAVAAALEGQRPVLQVGRLVWGFVLLGR